MEPYRSFPRDLCEIANDIVQLIGHKHWCHTPNHPCCPDPVILRFMITDLRTAPPTGQVDSATLQALRAAHKELRAARQAGYKVSEHAFSDLHACALRGTRVSDGRGGRVVSHGCGRA